MKRIKNGAARLLSLLLALLLLLPLSACGGCGGASHPTVMEYEGLRLTEDIYRYWLSCYRAQFSSLEKEHGTDRLHEIADINIRKSLIAAAMFDRLGLQLDTLARNQINAAMEQLVSDAGGTREALNEMAAPYGIDYDGLKMAISYEQKATALLSYLFGKNGIYGITEEQKEAYYQENYRRVRVLTVLYVTYQLDDDGERIFDEKTQSYVYIRKSGAALDAQKAKADAVRAGVAYGLSDESFLSLMKTYNEDTVKEDAYPNGYYFSADGDYRGYISEIPAAAVKLKDGEVTEVESEYGVHFIYAPGNDKGAYANEKNADFFADFDDRIRMSFFEDYIEARLPDVKVYREVREKIRYTDVPRNYDIYW